MLTDTAVKKLTPRPTAYRVFDGGDVPGFGVQVTPAGSKTWFLRYSWRGARRYLVLGHYPHTGTAAGRQKAREALARIDQGIDPAAPEPAALGGMGALLAAWTESQRLAGKRRVDDAERIIRANCGPWLDRPAAEIRPADIRQMLAAVHKRGARVLANRLRAHLRVMFSYGLKHDLDPKTLHQAILFGLTVNPVDSIPRDAGAERPGERSLSWTEVRKVWHSETLTWPARQACRLLIATGQRVNEIVQAPWSEFDLDGGLWTLPAGRSKNRREHVIPLPSLALATLGELRDVLGSDWLFPARNASHAERPWGEGALAHAVRDAGYDWTPRDLRRTWKTLAGECGLSKDIRDRVQNHARQDVSSRHYDRYEYLPEKRAALETWDRELAARLAGDNVVALRRKEHGY